MGQNVIAAVESADDLVLVAAVDPRHGSLSLGEGVLSCATVADLPDGIADVLVDFSIASAAEQHLVGALKRGFHLVVGTTGLSAAATTAAHEAAEAGPGHLLVAANFALGAVLAMRFAEIAAPYFESVEVIELHHAAKRDAPSGTSLKTAERIASARSAAGLEDCADPTESTVVEGARGGRAPGGVHIHSVRLPGLVAHEEILFGGPGEGLTIRHDSYDRISFMAGVLLAVRSIADRPGVTVGLDALLEG
jgi:4-hydroxy-tetrahydrodipicolinate reductase